VKLQKVTNELNYIAIKRSTMSDQHDLAAVTSNHADRPDSAKPAQTGWIHSGGKNRNVGLYCDIPKAVGEIIK